MKKTIQAGLFVLSALSAGMVLAQNVIRTQAPVAEAPKPVENWQPYDTLYSSWSDVGLAYGCSNWTPDPSSVTVNSSFLQTATDCSQDQSRTVQAQERETTSLVVRPIGSATTETRTVSVSQTRNAVGTKETWSATSPRYTEWTNSGELTACTNWTPDAATIDQGVVFEQTATDCKQPQSRVRQAREYEPNLAQYRDVGEPVVETRELLNQTTTREATGTKDPLAIGRFYRVLIERPTDLNARYSEYSEIEFLDVNGNDLSNLYAVTTNQSSNLSGWKAISLIDNNPGSKWASALDKHIDAWTTFLFPSDVSVRSISMQIVTGPSSVIRAPMHFQFQISYDSGVNWTTIKRISDLTWANGEKKTFSLAP